MLAFHSWLLGKDSQREITGGTGRSFRAKTDWCWQIDVPQPSITGEIYRQIAVDGTYFHHWCLLIAFNSKHVIAWQWCDRESKASWSALLSRIPAPDVVVTDGGTGLRAALDAHWTRTHIQRCYFHIFQTVTRHTTRRPRLQAGQEILALTHDLMRVHDLDSAATWMGDYATWETHWSSFLKERTWNRPGIDRPQGVKANQTWWYKHQELRRVQGLYRRLIADKSLFTWLTQSHHTPPEIARTTSPLEGGINAGIKDLLRRHRGMTTDHARRAVEWHLNTLTEFPKDPWELAKHHLTNPAPEASPKPKATPLGPETYGTGLTAEEGLWTRKGWAGRSH